MDTMGKLLTIPEVEGMTFDEDAHIYRVDGLEIPSVSAIMEPLSRAKYSGINAKTLEKAAEKGTSAPVCRCSTSRGRRRSTPYAPPGHPGCRT